MVLNRKPTAEEEAIFQLEAQAIVALAFRNGPIEDVHAGKQCEACKGRADISRITQAEMREIMKHAVDSVYTLLQMKRHDLDSYARILEHGSHYVWEWDKPEVKKELYLPTRRPDAQPE